MQRQMTGYYVLRRYCMSTLILLSFTLQSHNTWNKYFSVNTNDLSNISFQDYYLYLLLISCQISCRYLEERCFFICNLLNTNCFLLDSYILSLKIPLNFKTYFQCIICGTIFITCHNLMQMCLQVSSFLKQIELIHSG